MDFFANPSSVALHWLLSNYTELLATLTGLIYIVYSVRGKTILWLFGLISSFLYIFVFFKAGLYALMCINFYYVIISIYGWFHWSYPSKNTKKELPVSRITSKLSIYLLLISLVLFALIGIGLDRYTDSDIAIWDALITAFSITATWMLARKIMEHWLVWIVIDLIAVIVYIYKGLYPTVVLYLVFAALAIAGFKEWKKQWKGQEASLNA
jgi:nicotinamide mononucleotide transporter